MCGCTPETNVAFCKRFGATCGAVSGADNCGGARNVENCGSCVGAGETCGGATKANVCGCTSETDGSFCARLGATCGSRGGLDNCGKGRNVVSCGTCSGTGESCGAAGKANVCACIAESDTSFCKRMGATCGGVGGADNCGNARNVASCGGCVGTGVTCGGGTKANVCGCTPETDAGICTRLGAACGAVSTIDNCGGKRSVASCGDCGGPGESCGGAGKANVCGCTPEGDNVFCKRVGASCGAMSAADNCGQARAVESCGTCSGTGESCGGAGKTNVCGCTSESEKALCERLGATCGSASGADNCGTNRTAADCGGCTGTGVTCGGGAKANTCGCTPETDAVFCTRVGAVCGAKSGTDNCGVARGVAACGACGPHTFCTEQNTCFTSELAGTTALMTGPGLNTCGEGRNESCGRSLLVAEGSFLRGAGKANPATVGEFRLDAFEVTVGRFRQFVDAWAKGWRPKAGAGKHAHLNAGRGLVDTTGGHESGWTDAWTRYVGAPSASGVVPEKPGASNVSGFTSALACSKQNQTWTPVAGTNESRPQNCLSWYDLAAFCTWDGGFLPSETEWEYAAAGGSEERAYPWGSTEPGSDAALAAYGCFFSGSGTCTGVGNVAPAGSIAAGNGKWGQSDLAGNVWEWTLDWLAPLTTTCVNCSKATGGADRVVRGGAYDNETAYLPSAVRISRYPALRNENTGGRCARKP